MKKLLLVCLFASLFVASSTSANQFTDWVRRHFGLSEKERKPRPDEFGDWGEGQVITGVQEGSRKNSIIVTYEDFYQIKFSAGVAYKDYLVDMLSTWGSNDEYKKDRRVRFYYENIEELGLKIFKCCEDRGFLKTGGGNFYCAEKPFTVYWNHDGNFNVE